MQSLQAPPRPDGSNHDDVAQLPADAVLKSFGAAPAGLGDQEVQSLRAIHGANAVEQVEPFFRQFTHLFALLLWVGSILAVIAGEPTMAIAIVAVIVLNGLFGFWQEFPAEQAVAAPRRLLPARATVVRDGREQQVLAEEVVPEDVLVIREGDQIAADARLFEYTPMGQQMFGTAGVPVWWWLVCAAAIVPAFLTEEARKWLVRRRTALR